MVQMQYCNMVNAYKIQTGYTLVIKVLENKLLIIRCYCSNFK